MIRSLGARLFAAAAIFVTIALLLTWLALTRLFTDFGSREYERELQAVADTIVANLSIANGAMVLRNMPTDSRFEIAAGGRYWQVNGPSGFEKRSPSLWDISIDTSKSVRSKSALQLSDGPSGAQLLVLAQDATLERNGQEYKAVVQVAADYSEYIDALDSFHSRIFSMLTLTGLFLLSAAALQIFVGLKPLKNMRMAVSAMRQGAGEQIDLKGPTEVRPLIAEINTLMADNRTAVERARARASDLVHGLKTPLTILGQISESLSKNGDNHNARMMEQQVSTIRSRVDRQLALARAGKPGDNKLDAAVVLNKLMVATKPLADAAHLTIRTEASEGLIISADTTDFLEAVGNLVDNAIRYARAHILVSAIAVPAGVQIEVKDDGPGIAIEDRSLALDRGQRLDDSGEGTGLGLAICTDIVTAYGGSISLDKPDTGGLLVRLFWPAQQVH
jgi:signal transduction histidine kinase